jgi:hypothetical protein
MASNSVPRIDKLDFDQSRRPLLGDDASELSPGQSTAPSVAGSFFEQVAHGVQVRDRRKLEHVLTKYVSFVVAVLCWYGNLKYECNIPANKSTVYVVDL